MKPRQQLIKKIFFPLWVIKMQSKRLEYLKEYERTQYLTMKEIRELQWLRLKKLLGHAYKNCPFYKKRFDDNGITPENIKTPDDMLKIPLLTKHDIQENMNGMIAVTHSDVSLIKDMTGGSTGSPLIFYYDSYRLDSREASRIRHNRWAGWDIGDKIAYLWGAPIDFSPRKSFKTKLRNILLCEDYLVQDTSALTEENMLSFCNKIKDYRPKIIQAYAKSMVLLSKFVLAKKLTGFRLSSIICTSEVLLPEERDIIEGAFGCKVFNRYGSREVALIASECDHHEGLHVNAESLFLEFMRDGKHTENGESGLIVITDLLNYAMPLIRYKIEDVGKSINKDCSCGRGLPLMNIDEGRVTDFIVTPKGKMVSGVVIATFVITNISGILQVQLIQEKIDEVRVKVIKDERFTESSYNQLMGNLRKFLGQDILITIDFVSEIPKSSSGKYRFTISKIVPQF